MKHVQPHVRGNPLMLIAEPTSQVRDETHQSGGRRLQRRRCCGEALLLAERRKERHGRWTRRWRCDRTTACCNQAPPLVIARASTTPRTPFGPQPSPPPAQASFRADSLLISKDDICTRNLVTSTCGKNGAVGLSSIQASFRFWTGPFRF